MNKKESSRVMQSVKATLSFEGLKPSSHASRISLRYLEGKLTKQEARAQIMRKYLVNINEKR